MKNTILILVLIFTSVSFAQSQFGYDFNTFKINTFQNFKNQFSFENKDSIFLNRNYLKNSFSNEKPLNTSKKFSILIDNTMSFQSISLNLNFSNLDNKFFKNPYEGYENDLSNFLPQVPDLNLMCSY